MPATRRSLQLLGHSVSVVRPRQRIDSVPGTPGDGSVTLVRAMAVPGVAGLRVGWPAGAVLRERWTTDRPDVVYVATEGPLGWSAVRTAHCVGIPVFSGFHTNFHRYARHYRAKGLQPAILWYLRRFHRRACGTLASSDLRDALNAAGFTNLRVLGRGVDAQLFTPVRRCPALRATWGAADDDLVALHVGRIAPEKNRRLAEAALPLRVVHLGTVWTVLFTEPGRYHWLLQYYLRLEGVTLSWVGTGRCLSSMDYTGKDYEALQDKLLAAAHQMKADGWWLTAAEHPGRDKRMRARLVREMMGSLVRVPRPLQSFYAEVMRRKRDDHHASHSNTVNQLLHIISSSAFIVCYVLAFRDLTIAMWAGWAALFLRQIGHAVLEPSCHDKEALLLGYNTRSKTLILGVYVLIPVLHLLGPGARTGDGLRSLAASVAWEWFLWTLAVVAGRVAYLVWTHGARPALVWFVKLVTDPVTDLLAYSPRFLGVERGPRSRWTQPDEPR
jgi:Glycosyltransferase Family 4